MTRIFLSASVPLPDRNPKYLATADVLAIRDAVKGLISTVLDRATVVFGGHPAITPLVALLLRGMPKETKRRVVLYQSGFFERDFLTENDEFIDLRVTPAVTGDRTASLLAMRRAMIRSEPIDAAVFVGGMEGIREEYQEFHDAYPHAPCYPIASTGAAALDLFEEIARDRRYLMNELTYPTLFRRLLREVEAQKRG